ncbi:MAG: hypothetical protein IJE68_02135 [Clostridia bacterium]|nr:hypothetical protein [Clostridia bacterium]
MTQDIEDRKRKFLDKLYTARYNLRKVTETEETESTLKKDWFKDYGIVTTRYLQEVYLINTPTDFPKRLNMANSRHESVVKSLKLSFNTLDGIVKSCEKWKDYLADQQSFELLVCLEVMSMTKIHASVIAARNFHEKQGAMGVRLKDDVYIPYLFTTIVSHFGEVMVYS